jgi:excisionase family DNA binding protein
MPNHTARLEKSQAHTAAQQTTFADLLTVRQAAEALAVSQNTVRNLIHSQDLAAVRVGRRMVRIRQADLDAILKPYEGGQAGGWSHL